MVSSLKRFLRGFVRHRSNEPLQPEQPENPPTSAEECYNTAMRLWNADDSSPDDKKKAFQLWLHAANNLNDALSAACVGSILDKNVKHKRKHVIPADAVRAKHLYERAIDAGIEDVTVNLGVLLKNGAEGIERDTLRAKQLFERAARAGDALAMNNLANLFVNGAEGIERDTLRAKQLYEKAVNAGDVDAMTNLANLLENGAEGIERDTLRAKQLYERAARAGDVDAMTNLGLLLARGAEGIERDTLRAKQLIERAARAGNRRAMNSLANLLVLHGAEEIESDAVRAKQLYGRAARAGNTRAMNNLGSLLQHGAEGIERDALRAKQLFERAVDTGDTNAMTNLGALLARGAEGIERDVLRAKQLYERAVDAGNANAMNSLANLLVLHGAEEIERDAVRAKQLYERAADAGNAFAMVTLGSFLQNGAEGMERDTLRAKQLFERAADAGDAGAMNNLGLLLQHGAEGIERDALRAKQLYERAADAGDANAMNNLGALLANGAEEIERDTLRAKQLFERAAHLGNLHAAMMLMKFQEESAIAESDVERFSDIFANNSSHVGGAGATAGGHSSTVDISANGNETPGINISSSEGIAVPYYHRRSHTLHHEARKQYTVLGLLLRARYCTTGDETTPRDVTQASECYQQAVLLARATTERALARAEYARFLLELDEQDVQAPYVDKRKRLEKATQLLEQSLDMHPLHSALKDLINIYTHCTLAEFRNPQRANELKRLEDVYDHPYCKNNMARFLEAGKDSNRRLISVMREAMVKPRSCLLLILGAPGRGKTATLNSLRGLDFVSDHIPTQLADISQFVIEPGSRVTDETFLRDLDFRENSVRAIVSRLTREDVVRCERNMGADICRADIVAEKHRDVLEMVRGAATGSEIGCKNSHFVRCWDMGGQSEYEMAHSLFIARADILMFVANLKRVCDVDTRKEEVSRLCYWMQLAHMTVSDASKVRVIIVGTRKGEVESPGEAIDLLIDEIRHQLTKSVDDDWVRVTSAKRGCDFTAIENSAAIKDTNGSGLKHLSETLKQHAKEVLAQREAIPLKWLAFVDKIRREQGTKKVLWTRREVEKLCEDFPGFPIEKHLRNEELIQGLRRMTTLTGVTSTVLFELGNSEWVVSVSPERVLDMFRSVTSRRRWKTRSMEQEHFRKLDKYGILNEGTLMCEIWGADYEETEKRAMIDLLCNCDLLVRLRERDVRELESHVTYGIPCLLESDRPYRAEKADDETMIGIVTKFNPSLPRGLQGRLMANLSRTVHYGLQDVDMVGPSSTRLVLEHGRVIVEYKAGEGEILWTGIGKNPLHLVDKCLKQMDTFLRHWASPVRVRSENVFRRKHCENWNDIEVDYNALQKSGLKVRCKVCKVPEMLSKLCEDLARNENSSSNGTGDTHHDFRFVSCDLLSEISARREAVISYFDREVVEEACKGLSRVLEVRDEDDVKRFGEQLKGSDTEAYEKHYTNCWEEDTFLFAISYKQVDENTRIEGRFKFSNEQWKNLKTVLKEIGMRGVARCRIWLDQCLWLRDAPQRSWAACGLFPYLLWPVIALGDRKHDSDRTTVTYERMWPFVEEVLGLWSLGVITASAERGSLKKDGCRKSIVRSHRRMLQPEESMRLLLLNIYHGGTEGLKTGWTEDVKELQEIANWNLELGSEKLIVRPDWRRVIASAQVPKPFTSILRQMVLRTKKGEFLDASKRITHEREWHGLIEWTSGNLSDVNMSKEDRDALMNTFAKIKVTTNIGRFVLLGFEPNENFAMWLLVALAEDTECFNLDNVVWTKIVHGDHSCLLRRDSVSQVVGHVLNKELRKTVDGVRVVDT